MPIVCWFGEPPERAPTALNIKHSEVVLGNRALLIVPVVLFAGSRFGMRATSNTPDMILVAGRLGMSAKAYSSAALIMDGLRKRRVWINL